MIASSYEYGVLCAQAERMLCVVAAKAFLPNRPQRPDYAMYQRVYNMMDDPLQTQADWRVAKYGHGMTPVGVILKSLNKKGENYFV